MAVNEFVTLGRCDFVKKVQIINKTKNKCNLKFCNIIKCCACQANREGTREMCIKLGKVIAKCNYVKMSIKGQMALLAIHAFVD